MAPKNCFGSLEVSLIFKKNFPKSSFWHLGEGGGGHHILNRNFPFFKEHDGILFSDIIEHNCQKRAYLKKRKPERNDTLVDMPFNITHPIAFFFKFTSHFSLVCHYPWFEPIIQLWTFFYFFIHVVPVHTNLIVYLTFSLLQLFMQLPIAFTDMWSLWQYFRVFFLSETSSVCHELHLVHDVDFLASIK